MRLIPGEYPALKVMTNWSLDRGSEDEEQVPRRTEPWQRQILMPKLALEPLFKYPQLFSLKKGELIDLDEVRRIVGKEEPQVVEQIVDIARRNSSWQESEGNMLNPFRINFLTSLQAAAENVLWPAETEDQPENLRFAEFASGWLKERFTDQEYEELKQRLVGIRAIMEIKKTKGKIIGGEIIGRQDISLEEALRVFDLAKIALAITNSYVETAVNEPILKGLIMAIKKPLPNEAELDCHERYLKLRAKTEAVKIGKFVVEENAAI